MKNQVRFINGAFKVRYNGRLCSPDFNTKGAAQAYLDLLNRGQRKPEYEVN